MRVYFFILLLILEPSFSYAMDDVESIKEQIHQQLERVRQHLTSVDESAGRLVISHRREIEELRRSVLPSSSPLQGAAGEGYRDIPVHTSIYREQDRTGRYRDIPVHLSLDYLPPIVNVGDIITSNENYFRRLGILSQENERLRLAPSGLVGSISLTSPPEAPFSNQAQVREVRYKRGWSSPEVILHLFLTHSLRGYTPQETDIIESNENYFRRFQEQEIQTKFLSQNKEKLEKDLVDLKNKSDLLSSSISQKDQEISALQIQLQRSNESHAILDKNFQETSRENQILNQQVEDQRTRLDNEKRIHGTTQRNLEEEINKLRNQIRMGSSYVKDLEQKEEELKKRLTRQIEESKTEISMLKESHKRDFQQHDRRAEDLMKKGFEELERAALNRKEAVDALYNYKRVVKHVLDTPSYRDLLKNIEEDLGVYRTVGNL